MTQVPDMAELYRRLFDQLSTKFGGAIDEANADAIAYVAAELYHREFEPHLWDEKSAHEVLDALGAPRAGVFAPYSLRERLLALQRRIGTSEAVRRGHELLNSLGVPTEDEDGTELTLRQRIDRLRSAQPLVAVAAAAPPPSGNGAGHPAPADVGLVDEPTDEDRSDPPVAVDGPRPEADEEAVVVDEAASETEAGESQADEAEADEAGEAASETEAEADEAEAGEAPGEDEGDGEPGGAVDVVDVDEDSGAAPLVEAVRALEEAARVEAEMAPQAAASLNVDGLSETLAGLQDEVAALRTLVESLATDLRERLEAVHEEVLVLTGKLQPTGTEVVVLPKALEQTADLPPVPDAVLDTDGPIDDNGHKRRRRRLLLVFLLVLLGLVIAGLIVVTVVFGWDAVRDEMTDLTSVVPVFSAARPGSPEGVVP